MHEGAETPSIGVTAAISGFFTSIATNTSDYSRRLKRRPTSEYQPEITKRTPKIESMDRNPEGKTKDSVQLERLAWRMARRTYEGRIHDNLTKDPVVHGPARLLAHKPRRKTEYGRAQQLASATIHYAGDLTETVMKGE